MIRQSMPEFAQSFRTHFPDLGPANDVLCRVLSGFRMEPHLDPLLLDAAIEAKHGVYTGSLKDFVIRQYGAAAAAWVMEAM